MKKILGIICAAAIAVSVSGCSSKVQEKPFEPKMDTNETAVITVTGSWSNFEALETVASDWNIIYPNVTIDYNRVDEYPKNLNVLVESQNAPEIIVFNTNDYYINKDVIIDNLLDLSKIGLNTEIYSKKQLESTMINGKMCVLNWGVRAPGFVVNKTLLASLGLSVPETHDDFMKVCETLKSNGYTPIQGCSSSVYENILKNEIDFKIFASADSDKIKTAISNTENGFGNYFSDEFKAMSELVEKGYIDYSINNSIEDIYEKSILHFFEGKTPFLCFTTEGFSGMKKRESKSEKFTNNPFEYQFVSLPISSDKPVLSSNSFGSLAILEKSKNVEWAKEFLRFVCYKEEINKMAKTKGVPSVIDNNDNSYFSELDKIPQERRVICDYLAEEKAIEQSIAAAFYETAKGSLKNADEALKYFEDYYKKLFSK